MTKRNFVLRTIVKGRAYILGDWYYPDPRWMEYDGRLDGQRFAFGLYYSGEKRLPLACLWGTEYAYYHLEEDCGPGPDMVDGAYPWTWWKPQERWERT